MNKKGQIYILAALIISVVVFVLALRPNVVVQEKLEDDFEKLSENYEYESTRFVNSLIKQDIDITGSFFNFTLLFTSFSKSQNPNFNLIYAFGFNNEVHVGNFMEEEIVVDDGRTITPLPGCFDKINAVIGFQGLSFESDVEFSEVEACILTKEFTDEIWIGIDGLWYPFAISSKPQVMILSREESEEQRKVFVGGEGFIKGGEQKSAELFCNQFKDELSCSNKESCCWQGSFCTANCA